MPPSWPHVAEDREPHRARDRIHARSAPASDTPQLVAERAAQADKPWLSFFEPPQMQEKLRGVGFTSVELLTPAAAASRYFQAPSSLPTPQRTTIVAAVR